MFPTEFLSLGKEENIADLKKMKLHPSSLLRNQLHSNYEHGETKLRESTFLLTLEMDFAGSLDGTARHGCLIL